ncbi:hypothetical protein HQN64_13555 [Enterobacteriaceae bacterium BIT-l23]|uniref:Uncharacterized protein n=1 Tax=Jejubacter calystegiae TaxID=2579935 RepID=A0A4P8YEC6_9ENTR|nr:hypothetical protein [Jejubacter calystegiae]NUU67122.1 hypothetical protein [Enterobacteriaceae bacterium BIT-l23]QCT18153.1 hypothetical protein FEM41_00090 [Jejubacter calystegiae]
MTFPEIIKMNVIIWIFWAVELFVFVGLAWVASLILPDGYWVAFCALLLVVVTVVGIRVFNRVMEREQKK